MHEIPFYTKNSHEKHFFKFFNHNKRRPIEFSIINDFLLTTKKWIALLSNALCFSKEVTALFEKIIWKFKIYHRFVYTDFTKLGDFCQKLLEWEADCEADWVADWEACWEDDWEADWDGVEVVFFLSFRWDFTGIEIVSSISNFVFGFLFLWGRSELDWESIVEIKYWSFLIHCGPQVRELVL